MALDNNYGIVPPSGAHGTDWPVHHTLPQGASGSLSTAGWTADNISSGNFGNEGFIQQTFLGASIQNFDLNAGFGDTTSTINVQMVNDEFNKSDGLPLGDGDDPYHSGVQDTFLPPVVGTPVFFKFGKNPATVEQAFRQTYDDLYGIQTLPSKTNPKNAWGYFFPQESYDADNFDSLEDYHLVDLVDNVIEDRSLLWDNDTQWRGRNHFSFGGILQSYTQNKGPGGSPLFSASVSDPREILSSVDVLLNNYQGTTFNNKNIINVYGFLEYDPSVDLLADFEASKREAGVVEKFIYANGTVDYIGVSANWNDIGGWATVSPKTPANISSDPYTWSKAGLETHTTSSSNVNLKDQYYFGQSSFNGTVKPEYFPITGQGFSRRSDKGIPWYRVGQGLAAMFQYHGFMPQEYVTAGFGGQINFRGFNYVVDFSGIPTEKIPLLYYMDFDKIDLLSLAQELCDIISHDLYVTLLPVIDHPASKFLHDYNEDQFNRGTPEHMVVGIIRLDAIDRSVQPEYGAIKSYLDTLSERGIDVENQDVGFELANVTTDKFVVGGQEVDMHLFSTERDRDDLWKREANADNLNTLQMNQWDVRTQLQQQVIPYYGKLGNNAISVPRGFGSYQQILLDSSNLDAFGVGNYYVATELELRAALVSFDSWKNFLLSYNDVYIEDIGEHRAYFDALSEENDQIVGVLDQLKEDIDIDGLDPGTAKNKIVESLESLKTRQFAVTVPRCVWASDKPEMSEDGYPASPCSPPLGYPLYYKRATRVGILEAGIIGVLNAKTRIMSDAAELRKGLENQDSPMLRLAGEEGDTRLDRYISNLRDKVTALKSSNSDDYKKSQKYKDLAAAITEAEKVKTHSKKLLKNAKDSKNLDSYVQKISEQGNGSLARFMINIEKTAKKHTENAKKVYEFVRKIADECLGKKFLVRLPKSCNLNYNVQIKTFSGTDPHNIASGPFGFAPRPISSDPSYASSSDFAQTISALRDTRGIGRDSLFNHYLEDYANPAFPNGSARLGSSDNYSNGAMKGNYNPFSEKWEWNYKPEPQGGFYSHSLFGSNFTSLDYTNGTIPFSALPVAIQQGLVPIDTKNLLSDSNRLQCYVKYNNSHILDFTGVNSEDMTQQTITEAGQFVPDIVEDLPNNNIDAETTFDSISEVEKDQRLQTRKQNSVAFVKCSVEEGLFLPPKLETKNRAVWANEYNMRFAEPEVEMVEKPTGCTSTFDTQVKSIPIFSVPKDGGSDGTFASWTDFRRVYDSNLNAFIIDTNVPNLDDEHVYALITVPGRVKSTADVRWQDGPKQAYNTVRMKHLMTQDVVKIPEFSKPSLPKVDQSIANAACGPVPVFDYAWQAEDAAADYGLASEAHWRPNDLDRGLNDYFGTPLPEEGWRPGNKDTDWIRLSLEEVSSARRTAKTVLKGFALNQPQVELGFTSPSPIFPDIVAIPLMSEERCYGPWMSASQLDFSADARVKYSNIGGRVEFVKDENLAPWNYAGYQLMDEAGSLQANFSNSLLLFSERGGFVMPDAPTGIALATALQNGGPLITSIGISVGGDNGVKTTVKMDLYTSSFGKLQKQKEMSISQVARERQRTLDEKNNAIRRGLGKRQTSSDLVNTVMQAGGKIITEKATQIATQIQANEKLGRDIQETHIIVGKDSAASMQTDQLSDMLSQLDSSTLGGQLAKNAIMGVADMWRLVSSGPSPDLPSEEPVNSEALMDRVDDRSHND